MYFAILVALAGLLFIASGIAAIARGWVFKTRNPVLRPRLYGWGLLAIGFGACVQAADYAVVTDSGLRSLIQTAAIVGMALSTRLVYASRRPDEAELQDGAKP
ncbi:hypothetical protein [Streptomyces sp. NPDC096934]|uniref:hypothetical protein n=1 Tax=Streptomyces sp. NPDC096934 TaxID=3155551 RepID=UPI00331947C3